MSDEHRTALAQFRGVKRNFDIGNGNAGQQTEPRGGDMQGKKGRHGRDNGVAERLRDLGASDRTGTPGGKQESIAMDCPGLARTQRERGWSAEDGFLDSRTGEESDSSRSSF